LPRLAFRWRRRRINWVATRRDGWMLRLLKCSRSWKGKNCPTSPFIELPRSRLREGHPADSRGSPGRQGHLSYRHIGGACRFIDPTRTSDRLYVDFALIMRGLDATMRHGLRSEGSLSTPAATIFRTAHRSGGSICRSRGRKRTSEVHPCGSGGRASVADREG